MDIREQTSHTIQQKIALEVTEIAKLGLATQVFTAHDLFAELMLSTAASFQTILVLIRNKGQLTKEDEQFLNKLVSEKLSPVLAEIHEAVKERSSEVKEPQGKVIIP